MPSLPSQSDWRWLSMADDRTKDAVTAVVIALIGELIADLPRIVTAILDKEPNLTIEDLQPPTKEELRAEVDERMV